MDFNLNEPIAERKTKTVYKDGNKTIKLFVENYSKAAILNEALIQARVEENTDLKISKLLEVTKVENRWALVTEYVDGTPLDVLMEQNPEQEDEYLGVFIDMQLEVLSKRVPSLNRIKDKYKRKLEVANNLNENVKYELLQRLQGMENHDKLCHGDFNPSNIIIDNNGQYHIIDWAHATQGNASADIAKTYLMFLMRGKKEIAEKYLDLFAKKSEIDKVNVQRWLPIIAAVKMEKAEDEELEFLKRCIDIVDYE